MNKVLVAMSGGVDSSFSVYSLAARGFMCVGATMILGGKVGSGIDLAKQAARKSGVDHIVLNYSEEFKEHIILRFVKSYELGCTPNPCVWCNSLFKFGKLLTYAIDKGFDYLATGHYARVEFSERKSCFVLKRAVDQLKDQTYFLYFLKQEQLSKILFPLGNLTKQKIKSLATIYGLQSVNAAESQDICFVGGRNYVNFIKQVTNKSYSEGNFIDENGNVLGRHKGLISYTVGQRRGLNLSLKEPYYVKEIKPESNEIVLAPRNSLFIKKVALKNVSLVFMDEFKKSIFVTVKLRYSSAEFKAEVQFSSFDRAIVILDKPQIAPSRGQVVVFYEDDVVVGGGVVAECYS